MSPLSKCADGNWPAPEGPAWEEPRDTAVRPLPDQWGQVDNASVVSSKGNLRACPFTCSPAYPEPCALGPVSHCAEEHGEVKVKVLPSAAGTRDWASLFQGSPCQTPLLCGWSEGRARGRRRLQSLGLGAGAQQQAAGGCWKPLWNPLPGPDVGGGLLGPAGASVHNQRTTGHRVRDGPKSQSACS